MARAFEPSEVLSRPLMAMLATVAADGAPRNAPVWFLWEEDVLWMPGSVGSGSVVRLAADPRCAVEIVHFDCGAGILLHLGLRGSATVEPMAPTRFWRLLEKYLGPEAGWNDWFVARIARIDDLDGRLIRLAPDSVFTNNVSYFRTGPDLAWPPSRPAGP